MTSPANARAVNADGPFYRRWVTRFAALDDGNILRVAFFALLAGTAAVLFVDYRELTAIEDTALPMPARPILPPAQTGPDSGPMPNVTTAPELLQQPLDIALGSAGELSLTGTIDPGAAERFASEIAARGEYVRTVVLDSPGGSVRDALAIGDLIHDTGLDTQVLAGALCASSCPLIFAAGKERLASPDAAIGVHQIYAGALSGTPQDNARMAGMAISDAQSITARILTSLTRSGVDPALWLHALETPPEQLYYFSGDEMVSLKLVTQIVQK
ncbi:MAG: ATP-dependent Clp protease proteolytic subunit [Devosia sp.]